MTKNIWFWAFVALALVMSFLYSREHLTIKADDSVPKIAFLVGGPDQFWNVVTQGAKRSAAENRVELTLFVPEAGGADQTRQLLTLNPEKYQGVAISPLRPHEQSKAISVLAASTKVVTYDNDAPESLRHCHVGTNNYVAGTLCGQLVKEALPEGGTIAIFVGDHVRENAMLRRQGLVAALSGENRIPGVGLDPIDEKIEAGSYTIVATYLDESDSAKAKENAVQALQDYPDLDCMVALYGYNGPRCLEALKEAGKLGQVQVVAFDEHDATLDGIEAGQIYATVVQDPYQYGYEAVRLLAEMVRGNPYAIPFAGRGVSYLPCQSVKQENLAKFRSLLALRIDAAAD